MAKGTDGWAGGAKCGSTTGGYYAGIVEDAERIRDGCLRAVRNPP